MRNIHIATVFFRHGVRLRCCFFHSTPRSSNKTALVVGSSGSLGSTVSQYLSKELHMTVLGADVLELPNETDWQLDGFVPLPHFGQKPTLSALTTRLTKGVAEILEGENIDTIVCTSGGWEADPPTPGRDVPMGAVEMGASAYAESLEKMMKMNMYPVAAAGFVAQRFMANKGLFVVMGATAALSPTPGMLGYGMSKAASHHFVQTVGSMTGPALNTKSQRKVARKLRKDDEYLDTLTVVGILPTTIDTPSNRAANPDADFAQWTKPVDIAKEIATWIEQPPLRPHSGSLIKVSSPNPDGEGAFFQLAR